MQIIYMPEAKVDLDFWIQSGNKPALKKINQLLESIIETPHEGIGKPEDIIEIAYARPEKKGSDRVLEIK